MNDLIHNKIIFEVRYDFGYEYLDKCGLTIKEIVQNIHPFSLKTANPNSGNLYSEDDNITLNFNINKLDISQSQNINNEKLMTIDEFSDLSDKISQVIIKNINIKSLNRIGCRNIFLKGFNSREECFNFIKALPKIKGFLGQNYFDNLVETDFSFSFVEDIYKVRFKVAIGEQNIQIDPDIVKLSNIKPDKLSRDQKKARIQKMKAKKYIKSFPKFFVVFDVDMSDEFPDDDLTTINFNQFIKDAYNKSDKYINNLVK